MSNLFTNIFNFLVPSQNSSNNSLESFQQEEPTQQTEQNEPAFGQDAFDLPGSNVLDINNWSRYLNSKSIEYQLDQFRRDIKSYYLEPEIAELIDIAVRTIPPISRAYTSNLSFADTDINVNVKLKGYSEEQSQEIYKETRKKIISLYPDCYSDRDVSRFILGYFLRYGVFTSQKWFDENNKLSEIKIIPPWTLRWKSIEDVDFQKVNQEKQLEEKGYAFFKNWIPYQKSFRKGDIYIHPKGFLYVPLHAITNDKGKFFLPPLLAGIAHLPAYEMFMQALENIGKNTGFHKHLKIMLDTPAVEIIREDNDKAKIGGVSIWKFFNDAMEKIKNAINTTLKVAVMKIQPGLKVEDGTSFDVPSNLQDLQDLLLTEIVIGSKSYFNIIGYPGQVNQTTLSDTQKKVIRNDIETLQSCELSVHQHDTFSKFASDGYIVEKWEASHEPPNFDTEVQYEAARKLKLENDAKEEALKSGMITNTNFSEKK